MIDWDDLDEILGEELQDKEFRYSWDKICADRNWSFARRWWR